MLSKHEVVLSRKKDYELIELNTKKDFRLTPDQKVYDLSSFPQSVKQSASQDAAQTIQ